MSGLCLISLVYASFDAVEALPPHPNKHPITPLNTIRCYARTLLLSGRIPFVWLTLLVCVSVCVRPDGYQQIVVASRAVCWHINCFKAMSMEVVWGRGWGLLSSAVTSVPQAGRGSAGASAKTDDSFSIRAASVSTDWGENLGLAWLGCTNPAHPGKSFFFQFLLVFFYCIIAASIEKLE